MYHFRFTIQLNLIKSCSVIKEKKKKLFLLKADLYYRLASKRLYFSMFDFHRIEKKRIEVSRTMKIRSCHDTDHLDELLLQNYYSLIKLFISSSKIMSSTSSAP